MEDNQIEFQNENIEKTKSFKKSNKILVPVIIVSIIFCAIIVITDDPSKGFNPIGALFLFAAAIISLTSIILFLNNSLELKKNKNGKETSPIVKIFLFILIVVIFFQLLAMLA